MENDDKIDKIDKTKRNYPRYRWTRNLSQQEPSRSVHTFSRPPVLEALSLLPVAIRVGSYISQERKKKREPIFDLNGVMLEPPNPGPHGGCPLGGLGGGCIGRGYRGDFRRWSLYPGKYSHEIVHANQFCIRVKRKNKILSKVLSVFNGKQVDKSLRSWNWGVPAHTVTYHAVFPRAWTEFREPLPGINVEILQISPVIPNNYSDSSLPCSVFEINVTNLGEESIEVSVMFTFQNSDGIPKDKEPLHSEGFAHDTFSIHCNRRGSQVTDESTETDNSNNVSADDTFCKGVCMARHRISRVFHDKETSNVPLHNERVNESPRLVKIEKESQSLIDREASHSKSASMCSSDSASFGCQMNRSVNPDEYVFADQGSFAIAAHMSQNPEGAFVQQISTCERFVVSSDSKMPLKGNFVSAAQLWETFHGDGSLLQIKGIGNRKGSADEKSASAGTSALDEYCSANCASAVCIQSVATTGVTHFKFALAWDNPVVRFGSGRAYKRYFSRFFGSSGLSAPSIAAYALTQADEWNHRIELWQQSVVENDNLPEYYRHMLFNELYYLVDGGSVWIESEPLTSKKTLGDVTSRPYKILEEQKWDRLITYSELEEKVYVGATKGDLSEALSFQNSIDVGFIAKFMELNDKEVMGCEGNQDIVGRFLYLEGHEYLMYNTYDVHFYAGFALLMLWPQLELSLQRDFARSVDLEDSTFRVMLGEGEKRPRKMPGAVPHDLGSPTEDPFHQTNIYNFQDVSRWKDLGPKFVLQVYRDFKHAKSPWFLVDLYPAVLKVMESTCQFDRDNDGMIENEGFPDQTYDIWVASGVHAYCGGLWIAACLAMAAMGRELGDNAVIEKYSSLAEKASEVYVSQLWNGEYFNYDSSNSPHHDSIMADMMAGHWYAILCGLPTFIPQDKALSCYRKIFLYNVKRFGKGNLMGAVNGMRPDGSIDKSCLQSREVWTGTTYGLAAAMIHESKRDNGINYELFDMGVDTARGIYDAGWERFGYFFATPEAWEQSGNYRSLGYMRPLAIWAIQFALEFKDIPKES